MKKLLKQLIRKALRKLLGFGLEDLNLLSEQIKEAESRIAKIEHFRERFRTRVYLATQEFLPDPENGKFSYGFDANQVAQVSYRAFEDVFRGSSDLVKERLRPYERFFNKDETVLEIGCGRGEFLDLLAEKGVKYLGVDLDASMLENCKQRGLTSVIQEDYEAFLTRQLDQTFDGIFSFQFIEHIPPEKVEQFFLSCWRVVKTGGVVVIETVNPYSIEAFRAFHVDLTHQKVLYPEVLLYFCKAAGFKKAAVFYPQCGGFNESGYDETGQYAVIAYK